MILIISTCKETLSELEFVKPLQQLVENSFTKNYFDVTEDDIQKADKIIISGTALKDYDYLEHDFSWLKDCSKPVLGICAGMQLLAHAHGIKIEDFMTIGVKKVEVVQENSLVEGTFNAYFLHTKTGVGNFVTLAMTDGKPCMIKHPDRELYGCIFHPEVMNESIIANFVA